MQIFKFRAWNTVEKKMSDEFSFEDFDGDYFIPKAWHFRDMEVMQFIGRYDKNKKEIYEGDIVRVAFPDDWCHEEGDTEKHTNAGRVVCTSAVKWDNKQTRFYVDMMDAWYEWEIIGNIYENPTLL